MKTYKRGFELRDYRNFGEKREIPFGIKLKIWSGNIFTLMGLIFLAFGLPFSMVFISFSSLFGPSFSEKDPMAKGVIIESRSTNSSINDVTVYEYKYTYIVPRGNQYTGVGYTTGHTKSKGDEVQVQYKADNPELSKAMELRTSEFGGGIGFIVLIFPAIGFIMFFVGTRAALRQILILQVGKLTEGKYLYKEATNTKINNQTVYALTFEFTADDNKTYQTVAKTHKYHLLEDEPLEKLVYDPKQPENAVLLDALPKGVKNYFLQHV